MTMDKVVAFHAPEGFSLDPLTDLLRNGARELIAQAVEAELNAFLAAHTDQTDSASRKRPDAPGLSASTITRLKADWWDEYERWSNRDLSARRYVYFATRSFGPSVLGRWRLLHASDG